MSDKIIEFDIVRTSAYDSQHGFSSCDDGHLTKNRIVKYYEIELFVEDGGVAYIDDASYPINKHHVLVAKPGQTRHSQLHFKLYYIYLNIYSEQLKMQLNEISDFFEILHEQDYLTLFQELIEAENSDFEGKSLYQKSKIYQLLYMLYQDSKRTLTSKTDYNKKQLEKVRVYIDGHYMEPLSLSTMADIANLSPIYFHKLFKSFYGNTPANYLQDIRLAAAKNMLLTTDETIENIAFACGFTSQSYFNAVFKKQTNVSPLKYKKQELEKYKI